MIFTIILIVSCVILFVCILFIACRLYGCLLKYRHRLKEPGIDFNETIIIGDIRQCIYVRGKNKENPVLIYLHGGRGFPMMFGLHGFQYSWETHFTVVQWDQRLSGKTYFANPPKNILPTMSLEQSVQDLYELVQYIIRKLGKEKVIILGHSWGSVLGTAFVQSYPQFVLAYIGTGQVVNLRKAIGLQIEKARSKAQAANNIKDVHKLMLLQQQTNIPFDKAFIKAISGLQNYLKKYHLDTGIRLKTILGMLISPYYTSKELSYFTKNIFKWQYELLHYIFDEYDIYNFGINYQIPVYYLMGEKDMIAPPELARSFFDELIAPEKQFYTLSNAFHNAMIENKQGFLKLLQEISLKY